MSFIHLHNHTHYSILKGLPKPKDYIKKAKELGMTAVGITDTNAIHGCHEFYKYAKEEGIKPILGVEISLQSSIYVDMFHKIELLAKNYEGYKNIISLLTKANLDRPEIPYITFEELTQFSKDLICLSGPIIGEISYYILSGFDDKVILSKINEYENIFPGDFYVELIYHDDIPKQKLVTDKLIELHKKYHFKVVCTNDCFYISKEDKKTQDIIQALGTGHQIDNPDRETLINGDYSFLGSEEMESIFGFLPQAIGATKEIADKVDIEIKMGNILIPKYDLPLEDQEIYEKAIALEKNEKNIKKLTSDEWYLRYLSYKGLNYRYNYNIKEEDIFNFVKKGNAPGLQKKLTESSSEELMQISKTYYTSKKKNFFKKIEKEFVEKIERLEYELEVVHEMGFDAYFLIVADYINWARKNNIPVGPGRGSVAGSLMSYLIGITDIDPLLYQLLFERFLNPARISMPDIDVDFSDDGRDKVIEYCSEKYGNDHVAKICTFGTFAARAAVKDVGRVMGVDFVTMNNLAKLIPEKPGTKLIKALEKSVEFKEAYENNIKYKEIIDNALKIEGNVRQIGVHACAVIIAPEKITNYTGLMHPPKDSNAIITQYSAYPLEDLGLLKMDFLGLRNLTIIKRTIKIVKRNKNKDIDILNIDKNDKNVFKIFTSGDTTGVFQFESDGMRKYLIDLSPDSFNDLIAMVSLYRPGPLAYIPKYIDRKHKREEVTYMPEELINILTNAGYSKKEINEEKRKLEEDLIPILDITNGIAIYQEQLLFIVQIMAGFSLGEADLLRRGVGKKIKEVIEKIKIEFIEKAVNFRKYKPETPKYIYEEMIEPAANYSFNKSHAACYAFIAYQTAYLKAYYKTEFLTSLMVSDEENMDRIVLEVSECKSKGVDVLEPSINESMKHFTYIDNKTIRFGLKAIKGIGNGPINAIKKGREEGKYVSLEDFIKRAGKEVINKKSLEALILSGSLDEFEERGKLFKNIDKIIKFSKNQEKKVGINQMGLFDNFSGLHLNKTEPFSFEEIINGEKAVLGFSVSGHPLDGLLKYIEKRSKNARTLKLSFEELKKITNFDTKKITQIQTIGYITNIRKIVTKNLSMMLIINCESFLYDFDVTVFPKDYERFKASIEIGKIIVVSGILDINLEFKRKSIKARDINVLSITNVREQAISLGYFDNKKYDTFSKTKKILKEEEIDEKEMMLEDNQIDENIDGENNNYEDDYIPLDKENFKGEKYVIDIPITCKKEDLINLKKYMLTQKSGKIKIYIYIKGQEIYTKIDLESIDDLKKYEQNNLKK